MFQASGGGQFTFDGTGQYDLKRSWLANQSLSDAMEADAGGEKHELTRSWGTSTGFRSDSWTYGGSGTVMDQPADSWLPTLVGWTRSGDLNHKVTRDGQSSQSRISEAHGRLTAGESAGFRSWFIDSRGSEAFKVNNQRDVDGLNLDFSDAVDATYSGTSSLNTEDGLQTFTYDVLIDGNVQGGLGTYHERVVIDFLVSEPIAPAGNEIGAVNHDGTLTYEFWATPDAAGGSGFSYRIDLDVVDSITKDVDENWNDGSTETAWENAGHFVGHGSGNDNVFLDITGSTIVGGQPTMFQASGGGQFTFELPAFAPTPHHYLMLACKSRPTPYPRPHPHRIDCLP